MDTDLVHAEQFVERGLAIVSRLPATPEHGESLGWKATRGA
jgi:hypothetical protein